MRAFRNRCMFALMVTAVFSLGAVLLSPSSGLCTGSPPPPTYYLTVEKSVDQPSLILPKGQEGLVTFTVKVNFNTTEPVEGCFLPLYEGECVVLNDTQAGNLGKICYEDIAGLSKEFSYSLKVGPYVDCGEFSIVNTVEMKYNPIPPPPGPCYDTVTVKITVPCDEPGTGTPGYWMNHPEAWPVETITVGCVAYVKDEAIAFMKDPVKGDKSFTMFPALVAAKLNVLIGNDASCIAATIAAADAWLCANPLGTGVKGEAWALGEPLYWELDDYNNGYLCAPSRDEFD